MMNHQKLTEQYFNLLKEFTEKLDEKSLFEISQIGKTLVQSKVGPDVLLDIHSCCIKEMVKGLDPVTASRRILIANEILLNGIMAYSMSFYTTCEVLETSNKELQKLNNELEQQKRNAEEARLNADAANRSKSEFLANMSHELRTPLNSIIGFSDILYNELFGTLNSQQKEYVSYIVSSGKHLLGLINDILDLAKVETGKMELDLSNSSLEEIILSSIVMFKEKTMKHNIKLDYVIEPEAQIEIQADMRKLKQIFYNLLSNAVKFTPDNGKVLIYAKLHDNNFIKILIEDTGIGIKKEDIDKLFKEFTQIESPYTKKHEGTGLGLALCKKFIELHGGKIWVESEINMGSKFYFILPIRNNKK